MKTFFIIVAVGFAILHTSLAGNGKVVEKSGGGKDTLPDPITWNQENDCNVPIADCDNKPDCPLSVFRCGPDNECSRNKQCCYTNCCTRTCILKHTSLAGNGKVVEKSEGEKDTRPDPITWNQENDCNIPIADCDNKPDCPLSNFKCGPDNECSRNKKCCYINCCTRACIDYNKG